MWFGMDAQGQPPGNRPRTVILPCVARTEVTILTPSKLRTLAPAAARAATGWCTSDLSGIMRPRCRDTLSLSSTGKQHTYTVHNTQRRRKGDSSKGTQPNPFIHHQPPPTTTNHPPNSQDALRSKQKTHRYLPHSSAQGTGEPGRDPFAKQQ